MSSHKTFVRDATGLVRAISITDYAVTNLNAVNPLVALVYTAWFIWLGVPNADIVTACIGGFLLVVFGDIVVFAMTTATFPRSASPYVAESRVLHPSVGWPSEVSNWLSFTPLGLAGNGIILVSVGLVPGFYTLGVSLHNSSLVSLAFAVSQPLWSTVLIEALILITLAIAILGTGALVRTFQLPLTIVMFIGTFVMMGYWTTGSLTHLQALLPEYTNQSYTSIINYARATYPAAMGPISFAPIVVLTAVAFTVGSFNSYWGAWAAGEVKRGNSVRLNYLGMAIPSLILFLVIAYSLGMAQVTVGRDILVAMTQIFSYNPGFFNSLPSVGGFAGFIIIPMILADNPIAQLVMMLGSICAALTFYVYIWLICSRDLFAWSFDRLIPAKFADVNSRTGTPVFSLIFLAVLGCLFSPILTYAPQWLLYFPVLSYVLAVFSIGVLMLAGIFLPLKKDLWSVSPASKYKILGIPVISISGVLGFYLQFSAVFFYMTISAYGWSPQASEWLAGVIIAPFILYWIILRIRKSQGIDLGLIFRAVPPE